MEDSNIIFGTPVSLTPEDEKIIELIQYEVAVEKLADAYFNGEQKLSDALNVLKKQSKLPIKFKGPEKVA